jgi:hypothetical protein
MKKILSISIFTFLSIIGYTQVQLDDFGRIILNSHIAEKLELTSEVKNTLLTKLDQISSSNGMGGSQINPRFIITANVTIGSKDIVAGPPQMLAQNLELTLFIGDAITNTIFSTISLSLKGVGTNENKAYIDAFININPKNKEVVAFLEEGKTKIINYYSTNCNFILKDAQALTKQEKYDEAIYKLSLVPDVCKECYFKCLDTLTSIYQKKIDADCKIKLIQAKSLWAAQQTPIGAEKVGDILSTINPMASCQGEIESFIKTIDTKLKADEKARWEFKMKQYADKIEAQKEQVRITEEKQKRDDTYRETQSTRNFEIDKIRVNSYREVAIEFARNQPRTVTYNNIYWR